MIKLPTPEKTIGKPLMQAIHERKTSREIGGERFCDQELSNIFYAAAGMSRPEGKLTVGTARNALDVVLYGVMADGVYLYDAKKHQLKKILTGDIREYCGNQTEMHAKSPLIIVIASDYNKLKAAGIDPVKFDGYSRFHAGSVSQNIYLYGASQNYATVVCGSVDIPKLAKKMKLPDNIKIQVTQPIGKFVS